MDYDIEKLNFFQEELVKQLSSKDSFDKEKVKTVGGCDVSFKENRATCAIVVLDYNSLEVVEKKASEIDISMPYIPGYLSFREGPAILRTYRMLENKPDILLFGRNGILHPKKMGIASHMGILLNIVTIGVAKKLLLGDVKEDRVFVDGEERADIMHTKEGCNPIYVSPGHKISLATSVEIVRHCMKGHKLPEPIRLAHNLASESKRSG